MKKINNLLLPIYIILNIIYLTIGSYFFVNMKWTQYNLAQGFWIIAGINLLICLVVLIKKLIKMEKFHFKLIDLFILLIIIFSIISWIFAINRKVALTGSVGRWEGLFIIIYYFSILFLSTYVKKEDKKIIVYAILVSGIIQVFYSLCQVLSIFDVATVYHDQKPWASGFTYNPMFFATYMIICLGLSIGLYFDSEKLIKKILFILCSLCFTIGLFISNTLSCFIGLIFIFIIVLIYSIKNKYFSKLIIITVLLISTSITMHLLNATTMFSDFITMKNESQEIVSGNAQNYYGSGRIFIWKETLKIVPSHLIHGAGIDNFLYAFGKYPLQRNHIMYDKAHNEYLQILVTEGIFALISYLLLYGFIVVKGFKNSFKHKQIYLLLPVIGYLVQAFFNISVIVVAPILYICLGLLVDRD